MPCSSLCHASGLPVPQIGEHEKLFRSMHCSGSCRDKGAITFHNCYWDDGFHFLCWDTLNIHLGFCRLNLRDTTQTLTKPPFTSGLWGKCHSIFPFRIVFSFLIQFFRFFQQLISKSSNLQPFQLEYSTKGETSNLCISYNVAYADTDRLVCSRQVPPALACGAGSKPALAGLSSRSMC